MLEFAIKNLVQASTAHTPFFVSVLRYLCLPKVLKCDSNLRGGGHSSERQSGSHSSSADYEVTTLDADVDQINFGEE